MKKIKSLLCAALIFTFLGSVALPVYASECQPSLQEYQAAAKKMIQKYDMEDEMQYEILAVPDKTLSEYETYMEEMASSMAEAYQRLEEQRDCLLQVDATPVVTPRSPMYADKTYTDSKGYAMWFRLNVNYTVRTNYDNNQSYIIAVPYIMGTTSYVANVTGYTYSQRESGYTKNSDGTIHCHSIGPWRLVKGGITTEKGDTIIEADFGAGKVNSK